VLSLVRQLNEREEREVAGHMSPSREQLQLRGSEQTSICLGN